jgi:DNA-binding HxlR family transcriptional regulator
MNLRYYQFCPISRAAEVLGERWTILVVRELLLGTTRFSDFQRALAQISPTLLTKRLNQLQDCGLVIRKPLPDQKRTEYHLTAAGRELKPVILGLGKWGMKWARGQMSDDELDVQLLMYDFCRRLDGTQLPGGRTVIEFIFTELPKFEHWWIVVEDTKERELCVNNPGKRSDIQIRSDLRTMVEIWTGDLEIRDAKKDGRLQLSGNPLLVRTVALWLRSGLLADIRPHPDSLKLGNAPIGDDQRQDGRSALLYYRTPEALSVAAPG